MLPQVSCSVETDVEVEFGVPDVFRDQGLWRERGENRAGQRKILTNSLG